jgi:hypothetical protein
MPHLRSSAHLLGNKPDYQQIHRQDDRVDRHRDQVLASASTTIKATPLAIRTLVLQIQQSRDSPRAFD